MRSRRQPNIWVIKTRENKDDGSYGWHWKCYLSEDERDRDADEASQNWGGENWIRSPYSKQLIRDEVREGDLVVCYQTDGREILGFTRMASDGKEESLGSGEYNCFDLAPPEEALVLNVPLRIPDLRATGCNPHCFTNGTQGTVFPVEPTELNGIIKATLIACPRQEGKLRAWFKKWGYRIIES